MICVKRKIAPLFLVGSLMSLQAAAIPVTPALDTTFGGGILTSDFPASADQQIRALAIDGQNRVVAAGYSASGFLDGEFVLARYLPDGTLDTTFDSDGLVSLSHTSYQNFAFGVSHDADGNIIVVGKTTGGTPPFNLTEEMFLARYTSSGALDTSFNASGKVQSAIGTNSVAYAVQPLDSGKILVSGVSDGEFVLARYNADGSLDGSFGTGGIATGPTGTARAMAVDASGRILLAGHSNDFVLARFTSDGTLDASFGTGGVVTADAGGNDKAYGLALDSQGRILVSGSDNSDFAVMRFSPNGSLDASFGGGGVVIHNPSAGNDFAYGVAAQNDDSVLLLGSFTANFGLVRLDESGVLDASFNGSGAAMFDIAGGGMQDYPYALAIDSQGRVFAGGKAYNGSDFDFALARIEFEPVYDNDGVDAAEEDAVPNASGGGTGDGNGDGIADSLQEQVVSFNAQAGGTMMTLASSGASRPLINIQSLAAPVDAPENLDFPFGFFSFTLTGVSPGTTEQLSLFVPYNAEIDGLWKKTKNGDWVDIATAVSQQGSKTRIDFSITEGGLLDLDNDSTTITDPAGPSLTLSAPVPPAGAQPIPTLPLWALGLLSGLLALLGRRVLRA